MLDAKRPTTTYAASSVPAKDRDLLAGSPFRLVSKLAAGGMGVLYEAEHRTLGRRVVLKLLLPAFAGDPDLVARLRQEARVLARIASPHVVTVSDLGRTASGATYVAMER